MFRKIIIIVLITVSSTIFTLNFSSAGTYIVNGTKIYIYVQSIEGSTAHLIRFSKGMYNDGDHPWCGNRAYILTSDKELFATALAASLSEKLVNVYYTDSAPEMFAEGHATSRCKVFSIWW